MRTASAAAVAIRRGRAERGGRCITGEVRRRSDSRKRGGSGSAEPPRPGVRRIGPIGDQAPQPLRAAGLASDAPLGALAATTTDVVPTVRSVMAGAVVTWVAVG